MSEMEEQIPDDQSSADTTRETGDGGDSRFVNLKVS